MSAYAINKKATFNYEILEKFEAGLVLLGHEVKSIRAGGVSLKGGYITFHKDNAMLTNVHISKYKYTGNLNNYDPEKSRQLLLTKKEINYLRGKSQEKGLTIIPLRMYNKGRHIKLELGIAKGKKKYDKRRVIKEREQKRVVAKALKGDDRIR